MTILYKDSNYKLIRREVEDDFELSITFGKGKIHIYFDEALVYLGERKVLFSLGGIAHSHGSTAEIRNVPKELLIAIEKGMEKFVYKRTVPISSKRGK